MQGYIKLHRQIIENDLYFSERFTRLQAWIDLLLLASHKERTVIIRGNVINITAGQLCYSQLSLAERWKWNFKTVRKFLTYLEKQQMVAIKIDNVTTIISIQNWKRYQNSGEQSDEQNKNKTVTNNNVNNGNNVIVEQMVEILKKEEVDYDEYSFRKVYSEISDIYKEEEIKEAFNIGLSQWKDRKMSGNFLGYFITILKNKFG